MFFRVSIFSMLLAATLAIVHKIPSYISVCSKDDPEIKQCLYKNFETLRPHLAKGIPELQVPGVDPLSLPLVSLDSNNFHASFKDAVVHNASLYKVRSVNFDFDTITLEFVINFPTLKIVADYELQGKILILELKGQGDAVADLDDLTATILMKGAVEMKNNKAYYNFKDNSIDLNIGKAQFKFNKLFATNEQLTETTNKVINENWKDFYGELSPLIKDVVGAFVFPVATRVFKTFSVDELFPSNK